MATRGIQRPEMNDEPRMVETLLTVRRHGSAKGPLVRRSLRWRLVWAIFRLVAYVTTLVLFVILACVWASWYIGGPP